MNETGWVHQDAWYRRVVDQDTYLLVSRTTLNPDFEVRTVNDVRRECRPCWHYRLLRLDTGEVLFHGPGSHGKSYPDAVTAMRLADERVTELASLARQDAVKARKAHREARAAARVVAAAESAARAA